MVRIIAALFIATLLSGCIVLPLDYDDRGGPYYGHRHDHRHWGDRHRHHRGDDGGYWRYRDRRY